MPRVLLNNLDATGMAVCKQTPCLTII